MADAPMPPRACARCGECCGPVVCSAEEWGIIAAYAIVHGIEPRHQGSDCPFLRPDGCAIYEVRPRVCRLMGHSPRLCCNRVPNVNIGRKAERKYMDGYRPTILLHAACGIPLLKETPCSAAP